MTRLEHFKQSDIAMKHSALTERSAREVHALALEHLEASRRLVEVLRNLRGAAEDHAA